MRQLVLAILVVLAACDRPPRTWSGLPDGPTTCAWSDIVGQCITGGVAYSCILSRQTNHVECARVSAPSTLPLEQDK